MALPVFDTKDKIPAGFEEEYEEREGKWHPIDRTATLQATLEKERKAREAAEGLAKKAAKEAAAEKTKKEAEANGMTDAQLRALYEKIETQVREEYEPFKAEAETLRAENRAAKLDSKVKAMFKGAGSRDTNVDDFWQLYGSDFDLTADGKPMVKNEPGKDPMKHVQALVKQRPYWTQGTKATGGGGPGFQSTTPAAGSVNNGGLSFEDLTKNPAAAIAMANEP